MKNNANTTYHHKNLKDSLIDTALLMVKKDGISSITLRELSKKLGVSRSAIYRHFDSKDDLIKAIIQIAFSRFDAGIPVEIIESDDIVDSFRIMAKGYIGFAMDNPNIYRMMFGHEVGKQREESCDIENEDEAIGFHKLIALVQKAQDTNLFKKDNPMLQATVIWSMMHGLSNLLIDGHIIIKDNLDALFDLSFLTIINGLKK